MRPGSRRWSDPSGRIIIPCSSAGRKPDSRWNHKTRCCGLPQPVNKFPQLVQGLVQRLKSLCPSMGKVKIAQTLARAGLRLGATTVRRMLEEKPRRPALTAGSGDADKGRVVSAKRPNHVWHVDLTVVPTGRGLLGLVASLVPAAALAVLLVGRGCRRSFFTTGDGHHGLQDTADLTAQTAQRSPPPLRRLRLCGARAWRRAGAPLSTKERRRWSTSRRRCTCTATARWRCAIEHERSHTPWLIANCQRSAPA